MEEINGGKGKMVKVCVTGGSGYVGSYLINKLLHKGVYVVHATLRDLGDIKKVGLLKGLPGAETRLKLFEADIYNPQQFEPAVKDCQFVFHVATPMVHTTNSQYKDTVEAAVAGVKSIAMSCIRSGTVKRLIYTASVTAASPLKNDGSGYIDVMDESCWTSFDLPLDIIQDFEKGYMYSKTQAEKEVLKFGVTSSEYGGSLEVVSLTCGLIGGDTLLSYTPASVLTLVSQLTENELHYRLLRFFLEELVGKVPIIHIDDVCEAHIFCMEQDSFSGRFLCASEYVSSSEIAEYYKQKYPEFHVKQEYIEGPKRSIKWGSTKLIEKGFKYNCDINMILDDSVKCVRRFGVL